MLQNSVQQFLQNSSCFEAGLVIQKLHVFLMEISFGYLMFGKHVVTVHTTHFPYQLFSVLFT